MKWKSLVETVGPLIEIAIYAAVGYLLFEKHGLLTCSAFCFLSLQIFHLRGSRNRILDLVDTILATLEAYNAINQGNTQRWAQGAKIFIAHRNQLNKHQEDIDLALKFIDALGKVLPGAVTDDGKVNPDVKLVAVPKKPIKDGDLS